MIKKITILLLLVYSCVSYAQLGVPKTTVKDTLLILCVSYNETILEKEDWPDSYIVEDPINIYVAGFVYKKNKATQTETKHYSSSWEGHIDFVEYGNARCNGKKQRILIVRPHNDCKINFATKYVIGDYEFLVLSDYERMVSSIKTNSEN